MSFKTQIKTFAADETGAISPEIVGLGGVIFVLGIFVVAGVIRGVEDLDHADNYQVKQQDIISTF
ncbi:hypothetical protein [Litoreibacter albidus]|uniref:hypothetical protein n=1 Tax=Litoreibacter albidus TaxID=670155 RepID=UPI00373558A8